MTLKRICQIQDKKAHYIFNAEEIPEIHPSIILVDISGRNDIQEGWNYIDGEFTEPIIPQSPIKPPIPIEPSEVDIINEKLEVLEKENANLLLDSMDKEIRLNQTEEDLANILLTIGGM